MKLTGIDIWAGISYIASGGLAAVSVGLGTLLPSHQVLILQGSAIVVGVAGLLIRLHGNPSPPPGTEAAVKPKEGP